MKKFFFSAFVFCSFISTANAYYEYNHKLEKAYELILTLRLDEAKKILDAEVKEKPGNDLVHLYFNYIDFLKAFISEDENEFILLRTNSEKRIAHLNHKKENTLSPFHLYVQSEMLIQQSLVGIKFEENILSAKLIKRAYSYISKNEISFPTFILNNKVSGFLHVLIGSVPSRFQWIIHLAGMNGSVSDGLNELKNVYEALPRSPFVSCRTEILFYLGNIFSSFSLLSESEEILDKMRPFTGINPLISYVYANILMKQGKNDDALAVIDSALKISNTFPVVYLHYKRGIARLRKLDKEAGSDFQDFLRNYKGRNNIKSTYQKLAWLSLMKSDTAGYKNMIRLCAANGTELIDEDKDAQFEASSGEIPNLFLLRARLLFDGGYYLNALNEIRSRKISDFPHFHDQLEITYRLGRIMQMTEQTDKAREYFEMTLKNGFSSRYYFAANSSLFLGLIYEEKKNYILAKNYFEKCLSMDYDQYKNSIDQKAQMGLERVNLQLKKRK